MVRNLHDLAEARSLALHREVADRLALDPSLLAAAKERVLGWRRDEAVHPHYIEEWSRALERPLGELLAVLRDPSEKSRELRQASPFAGAIDARTRFRIHRETRTRWSSE